MKRLSELTNFTLCNQTVLKQKSLACFIPIDLVTRVVGHACFGVFVQCEFVAKPHLHRGQLMWEKSTQFSLLNVRKLFIVLTEFTRKWP